jgi:ATP-dependent helicase HepA
VLFRGMLVSLPEGRGVGKLEGVDGDTCSVAIFRSIIQSETVQFPVSDLTRAYLSPQTRVYVQDGERFRVGRVADFLTGDNGLIDYEVRFPNGKRADFSELKLFLRPWSAPDDPAEVLANGGAESQFLHDRRQAAMLPLLKLRGAAQGMTALVSAGIDLAPHQVAAVRRVLTDPVQRYLLADEVGLGKTIEAGLIARQHLIDDAETGVLVAVPAHLVAQWQQELRTKLRLDQFDGMVEVITHADLARVRQAPDILIVDEAHHLVGVEAGPLAPASAKLRVLADQAPVFLLLSATPALGDEARFLALLNLLDPSSHPLNDLEGFRRKLEGRREIGRLLLALDPEVPKLVLRQRGAEIERLFPDDPVIADLAPRLIAATREAPADLPALCAALKGHIADSYRIHQRLIRSRRADAQGWEFTPRGHDDGGEPSFAHVRVEADASCWVEPLLPLLEEWRFGVLDAAAGQEEALDAASRRYAGILSAMAEGRATLLAWIAEQGSRQAFTDEPDILARLARLAEEAETGGIYETACESTRRLVRSLRGEGSAPKIVAFSSSAAEASAFGAALSAVLDDCEVLLLTGDGAARNETILAAFASPRKPAVLVCDRSGEEGLNLAFADAIVHLDLPLSAARIEQRIGRLDRFGRRNGVVRHRIALPADEDDSPWTGWADFLCQGLGIYHRSISDVQFLLDEIERRLFRVLLEEGPAGVEALSVEARATIANERRSQDEQYALDRIALAEEPVETFIAALEEAEEDEAKLEEGVDRWLVGALQLKKRPFAWPEQDPFKFSAVKETLIPRQPWLEAFGLGEERPLTWRRRIATSHPEAMLLRPGSPLIDVTERFTRWDDRGTAFITWRTAPEWTDDPWLGFRLCFVVEPDIPVSDMFAPSRVELASIRRAQRYLSPRSLVIHVDGDGEVVQDRTLLSILDRPYRNASESVGRDGDVNLSSRPQALAGVIDPATFAALCRSVRDRTRDTLVAEPTLQDAIATGVRLAGAEIERRRGRLRQRHATGDAAARADLELIEALLPGLARPAVKLDAMGCFIVSRRAPQISSHD